MPKDKRGPEQLPGRFIELIGRLYKVEAEARRDTPEVQALHQQRQLHSVLLLKQIEALALQIAKRGHLDRGLGLWHESSGRDPGGRRSGMTNSRFVGQWNQQPRTAS